MLVQKMQYTGFFFAPVYPTSIAACGETLEGSNLAMGSLLTMAGFGKIIMPYLVGLIASQFTHYLKKQNP